MAVLGTWRWLLNIVVMVTATLKQASCQLLPDCLASCEGVDFGQAGDCQNCGRYIFCVSGQLFRFDCPAGLRYDSNSGVCRPAGSVPCSAESGANDVPSTAFSSTSGVTTNSPAPSTTTSRPTTTTTSTDTTTSTTTTTAAAAAISHSLLSTLSTVDPSTNPPTHPTAHSTFPTNPSTSATISPTNSPLSNPVTSPTADPKTFSTNSPTSYPSSRSTGALYNPSTFTSTAVQDQEPTIAKPACITNCRGLSNGNYQSCRSCRMYVTCMGWEITNDRLCPSVLLWNDALKTCAWSSSTCPETSRG